MTVQFRAASQNAQGNATNTTASRPTGTVEGDLLLAFHMSDRDGGSLTNMTAPSGWVEIGSQTSVGGQSPYCKIWQKTATASEPSSYTFGDGGGANACLGILALYDEDTTDPIAADPSWFATDADSNSHVANSVTGVAGGLLITAHFGETGGTSRNYSGIPSGMNERVDVALGSGGWCVLGVYTESLAAGGATGTRTATCSAVVPYATAALVVAPISSQAGSGTGSTGSRSSASGTGSGDHTSAGAADSRSAGASTATSTRTGSGAASTRTAPTAAAASTRSGSGTVSSRSAQTSVGTSDRAGFGSTGSTSQTSGEGIELKGGVASSRSSTSGETASGRFGSGATESRPDASAANSSARSGSGVVTAGRSSASGSGAGRHAATGAASSRSSTSGSGFSQQLAAAGIARPVVGLSLRMVDAAGNPGEYLPDWSEIDFTDPHNEPALVRVVYAKGGLREGLLLADRAEGALFDGALEIPNTRFMVRQREQDRIREDERTVTLNCPAWVPSRLSEARIYPPGWPSEIDVKQTFTNATPGSILLAALQQAQARGAADDVVFDFTATDDSTGTPWAQTVSLEIDAGESILGLIEKLVELGACDWRADKRELILLNPESGRDLTTGASPVVLQVGRDMLDAPERYDASELLTAVLVKGDDGVFVEVVDSGSLSIYGRLEGHYSVSGITDEGTLTAVGEALLARSRLPKTESTHELSLFDGAGPQPWVDYLTSDRILRDVADGTGPQPIRVTQLSATYRPGGEVTTQVTFGDRLYENAERLSKRIAALTGGSAGSTAPATNPPEDDGVPPSAPTGLAITSVAYGAGQSSKFAAVRATWADVTTNADGSTLTDLDRYEVQWRETGDTFFIAAGSSADNEVRWDGVATGINIEVRVRAVDSWGNASDWSAIQTHLTESDNVAPAVPTGITGSSRAGALKIVWDGTGLDGALVVAMPDDFKVAEVHVSTTSGFTPTDATLEDNLTGAGASIIANLSYTATYYVRLVAVDHTGNRSAPSAQIAVFVEYVEATDIGSVFATSILAGIVDAEIVVGDRITTSLTGQRVQLSNTGLQQFDSGENLRVSITPTMSTFTGQVQTNLSGARFVFNFGGSNPAQARIYPSSGSLFATLESRTVSGTGQAIILGRGNSTRGDQAAGEFGAHPTEGYIRWCVPGASGFDTPFSFWVARQFAAEGRGPQLDFIVERRYPNAAGESRHFGFIHASSTGSTIGSATMWFLLGGVNQPWIAALAQNCGILFDANSVSIVNGNGNFGPVGASSFNVNSDRRKKRNIRGIDFRRPGEPGRRRAESAIRRARASQWEYIDEAARPDLPGHRIFGPGEEGPEVDLGPAEWEWEPPAKPQHFGPMADDLIAVSPDLVWFAPGKPDEPVVNIANIAGLAWEAAAEAHDDIDELRAELAALRARVDANHPPQAAGAR